MAESNNSSVAAHDRPVPARPSKSAAAFRTISEVASDLDVAQHVLRFWESKFPQVRPMKRGGGRRYYRPEDVDLLRTIRSLLYDEGYTIKGAQKLLKGRRCFPEGDEVAPAEGRAAEPSDAGTAAPAPNAHRPVAARPAAGRAPAELRGRLERLRDELVSLRDLLRRAAE